ncbi:MAG: FAD-binding oxidoreductase [Bacteroidota bacterium]
MDVSVWEKESFYASSDILIVGGGLLGLWTARELKIRRPALKVTLIDKGVIPTGASTRNAGFACFGSPSEMLHDIKVMGATAMWQVADMRYRGIQKIRSVLKDDLTGFENSGGYECYNEMSAAEWQRFEEQVSALNKEMQLITGKENAFSSAPGKLAGYGLKGFSYMIENRLEGGLHSGKLVQALTQMVREMGVKILTGVEIAGYEHEPGGLKVSTLQKVQFHTKQLLLATNAFLASQLPGLGVVPARGQIILSPPIPGLALKGTFHFDGGYYYFRNLGNRVLIGGARNTDFTSEETLNMQTTGAIKTALYTFLQKHIPAAAMHPLENFESWSGLMAMHASKQPLLQMVHTNVFAAMCCNGMGVALSPVFSEQVAEVMLAN